MGQFGALFKKNFLQWRRNRCGMICEIATTIVFALLFILIGTQSEDKKKDATSYLADATMIGVTSTSPGATFAEKQQQNIARLMQSRFGPDVMKNCLQTEFDTEQGEADKTGFIALAPDGNDIVTSLETLFTTAFNFRVKKFQDFDDIKKYIDDQGEQYVKLDQNGEKNSICFGITFEPTSSRKWTYNFHYNVTGNPEYNDLYGFDEEEERVAPFEQENMSNLKKNIKSGLFYLINYIDTEILRKETSDNNAYINAKLVQAPTFAYKTSTVYNNLQGNMYNLIVFPLVVVFLRFTYAILFEKEHKIAQNLRNMGMSMYQFYFSWWLFYTLVLFGYSLIWTLITKGQIGPDVNFILYFFFYFMTGEFFICLGILISSFFSKAKPGVLTAIIAYFVLFGVGIAKSSISGKTLSTNTWFALSPLAGLEGATQITLLVQSFYQEFGFSLFGETILAFKYSIWFFITLIECVVFYLLGNYLDQVWPKDTGVAKHPLYCFMKKNKKAMKLNKSSESLSMNEKRSGEFFEDVDDNLKIQSENNTTLEIKNLNKIYGNKKHAVRGVDLTMYSDQIFALLGHNGAGKTTTISMISGLIPITVGEIKIMGFDSQTEGDKVTEIMGVCPQTNPIYPRLTCYEHLALYSKIKTPSKSETDREAEIETILKDIDLFDKKNFPAGNLSGGQKRKLCVACAFIGGSKVILLDEPTSGLDVSARRHLWNMLKKYKKDKIIILTTHFMDEADYLGDRIGVMGDGKLLTCGSSLFLKSKFGFGYSLTMVKSNAQVSTQNVTSLVKQHVPGAKLEGDISRELKYVLPTKELPQFEGLFQSLENKSQELGIDSYGVSLTTLEDVFLKIGEELGHHKKDEEEIGKVEDVKRSNLGEDGRTDNEQKQMIAEEEVELQEIREKSEAKIFWMHFHALIKKRFIYFKRDIKGLVCEIVLPIIIIWLGLLVTKIQFIREADPVSYSTPALFELSTNEVWVNSGQDAFTDKIPTTDTTIVKKTVADISAFDTLMKDNPEPNRLMSIFVEGVNTGTNLYEYALFVNSTAADSLHVGLILADNAILKLATSDNSASISVNMLPLPLTDHTKSFEGFVDGFVASFFIAISYAFIPSSLIMFLVTERENNAKHQQIVSGVSLSAYWYSNLLVDYVKYLIVALFTYLAILVYNIRAFLDGEAAFASIVLGLLFGPALIGFTYLTSFMFKGPSSAQIFTFIFSLFTGFILMLVALILRVIESTRSLSLNFLEYIFRIFPMFNYCFGMYTQTSGKFWEVIFKLDEKPGIWSEYGVTKEVIALIITSVLFFVLIFVIEKKKSSVKQDSKDESLIHHEKQEDEVLKEIEEVKNNENYAIKVQNMSKVYTMISNDDKKCCSCKKGGLLEKKVAVKGISFGVNKGDCFGLLGTNGAGKTTTFKIMSGEIQPTNGIVKINGMNVATDMQKIRHLIGYCPQFDALLNNLTTREHLELYAAIKGIPVNMREKLISEKIKQLNLTKYEHVQAGTYSGGNKRKLSVAIALLGNPPIVFLDEPSSGMDPEARRFMWSVVSRVSSGSKKSSVVLTTHSMEEAEALSTKLAIMVEGNVKCIGPVQALKNKYGQGFEIETKFREATVEELKDLMSMCGVTSLDEKISLSQIKEIFNRINRSALINEIHTDGKASYIANELEKSGSIKSKIVLDYIYIQIESENLQNFLSNKFGKVKVIESYQKFIRSKVEENLKLSQLFGEMERNKTELKLDQYSVKQTSIEQIFIGFAKQREQHL